MEDPSSVNMELMLLVLLEVELRMIIFSCIWMNLGQVDIFMDFITVS